MVFVCFCYPLKTNKGSTITRKTFDYHLFKFRAANETRTRDPQLGKFKRFTYESNCYAFLYAECLLASIFTPLSRIEWLLIEVLLHI